MKYLDCNSWYWVSCEFNFSIWAELDVVVWSSPFKSLVQAGLMVHACSKLKVSLSCWSLCLWLLSKLSPWSCAKVSACQRCTCVAVDCIERCAIKLVMVSKCSVAWLRWKRILLRGIASYWALSSIKRNFCAWICVAETETTRCASSTNQLIPSLRHKRVKNS